MLATNVLQVSSHADFFCIETLLGYHTERRFMPLHSSLVTNEHGQIETKFEDTIVIFRIPVRE